MRFSRLAWSGLLPKAMVLGSMTVALNTFATRDRSQNCGVPFSRSILNLQVPPIHNEALLELQWRSTAMPELEAIIAP